MKKKVEEQNAGCRLAPPVDEKLREEVAKIIEVIMYPDWYPDNSTLEFRGTGIKSNLSLVNWCAKTDTSHYQETSRSQAERLA